MIFKLFCALILTSLPCAYAHEEKETRLRRSEISQYEGEYEIQGKHVRKVPKPTYRPKQKFHSKSSPRNIKRKPASRRPPLLKKKNPKTFSKRSPKSAPGRAPASVKKSAIPKRRKAIPKARVDSQRGAVKSHVSNGDRSLPYVKHTPHERDLPFISIPNSRVRQQDKTIVMGDPESDSPPPPPPEPTTQDDSNFDRSPASAYSDNGPADMPPPDEPLPHLTGGGGMREPDAYDMHSDEEPILGR